MAQSSIKAMF
ncbi:hypothetical protein ODZ79_00220 [Escherichia coli]|nr:hypothetical protein [Escherichia coli]MCV9342180.1 hypothetical protein [Escherichia coli]